MTELEITQLMGPPIRKLAKMEQPKSINSSNNYAWITGVVIIGLALYGIFLLFLYGNLTKKFWTQIGVESTNF